MSEVISPGIYQHYKGKHYEVLYIAKHSETLAELVVYKSLYQNNTSQYWVRPLELFIESVEIEGRILPRFRRID